MGILKRDVFVSLMLITLLCSCNPFEVEHTKGELVIVIDRASDDQQLEKPSTLSTVQCVLLRKAETVYDKRIAKNNGGFNVEIDDLKPSDNYSVYVYGRDASNAIICRAYRSGISVSAGETATINISWQPFDVDLYSPSNGTTITDTTPKFDWGSVTNADHYVLQVSSSDGFTSPYIDLKNLSNHEYIPTNSLSDGSWYWRVRAEDSRGYWSGWSSVWEFTIDTEGPIAPTLIAPTDGSSTNDDTPTFDWSDVSDATVYKLEVSNSNTFSSLEINQSSLSSSTYTPSSTVSDGTWYWRVRAKDSQGNWGGWSSIWSVIIDTEGPSAPTLLSPSNGITTNDNTPAFDWSDVSGASMYELEVDNSSTFSSPEVNQTSLSSFVYTSTYSLSNGTWYWRVRAKDSQGNWSGWSSAWYFLIQEIQTSTMTGNDGTVYKTVRIGDQWWMAENLRETKYRDGSDITVVLENSIWEDLTIGARCVYNNNESHALTYGYLYNWYAVNDTRSIAPEGWHVPTDEEFKELELSIGFSQSEADKNQVYRGDVAAKIIGHLNLWQDGILKDSEEIGSIGFDGVPSGDRRAFQGFFIGLKEWCTFWSSTDYLWGNDPCAYYRDLSYDNRGIFRGYCSQQFGFSCRLVKD